eukprot:4663849-Lingulodinium_polyedra.AAC.1
MGSAFSAGRSAPLATAAGADPLTSRNGSATLAGPPCGVGAELHDGARHRHDAPAERETDAACVSG